MKNSKVINLVFLAAGGLLWFISLHYVSQWMGYFQLPRRLGAGAADAIHHGFPIVLGLATFLILRSNTKATYFVSDCVDELFRVVFPDAKAVRMGTIAVIILVIISGLVFGALDWGITSVIRILIGLKS